MTLIEYTTKSCDSKILTMPVWTFVFLFLPVGICLRSSDALIVLLPSGFEENRRTLFGKSLNQLVLEIMDYPAIICCVLFLHLRVGKTIIDLDMQRKWIEYSGGTSCLWSLLRTTITKLNLPDTAMMRKSLYYRWGCESVLLLILWA